MTEETRAKIEKSVRKVAGLVNDGHSPTQALKKVAVDSQLLPEQVRRAAESYNIGRSLAQQQTKSGSDRLEVFDLADPDTCLQQIVDEGSALPGDKPNFQDEQVPNLLAKSASLRKLAADVQESRPQPVNGAARLMRKMAADQKVLEAKSQAAIAEFRVVESLDRAVTELQNNFHKVAFSEIEQGLRGKYGNDLGNELAELLWDATCADRWKSVRAQGSKQADFNLSPYNMVDQFVAATMSELQARQSLKAAQEAAAEFTQPKPQPSRGSVEVNPFRMLCEAGPV